MNNSKTIYVYWNHGAAEANEMLGILTAQCIRNKEIFSFEFDAGWLASHQQYMLDPDLQFYGGTQFTQKSNFGVFMDSAPDRWGRKLMLRREAIRARKAGEKPRTLLESDFLLGVYDETRMGALRYKTSKDGSFENNDSLMPAPPWVNLRKLEEASRYIETDSLTSEQEHWLSLLLAPGSSLGGARPKACVTSSEGDLWIAKFPSKNDTNNISAWEYATMQMAKEAGLNVSPVKLETFSDKGSTFLTKRFDRAGKQRLHFASAMTLLGRTDGADASNSSYLDIAEFIMQNSCQPQKDLEELWRRIVFSIAVSNTDDHLRNHGFILCSQGWKLSPAYDLNPNPQGTGLSLNIDSDDNSLEYDLAMDAAPYFQLSAENANCILNKVRDTVSDWRYYAMRAGLAKETIDSFAPAFNL